MNTRILAWIAVVATSSILLCGGAVTALLGGSGLVPTSCYLPATTTSTLPEASAPAASTSPASPGTVPPVKGWSTEQVTNAAHIVAVGQRLSVPRRGWIIAVATAMQESGLRSLSGGDRDSVGLFQQRPSQGWGTPTQLKDPVYASTKFYRALLVVPGWQNMTVTDAAQIVQRSGYPGAYAKHEPAATVLVDAVAQQASGGTPGIACSEVAPGTAQPAPRNPDGSWPDEGCTIRPDPTTGGGCVTARLLHLVQQATNAGFPKPSCYRVDDHGEHPKGRACDWMMTNGGEASGAQKAHGDQMAAWAVANADRLGIAYVIWFRRIWTPAQGWHAYNNPWGGDDPSGWHTNHVHISVR